MRIYTRTGDSGETDLLGGIRIPKDHDRINAYGNIDELNAHIGLLHCLIEDAETGALLRSIQTRLFLAGSELARSGEGGPTAATVSDRDVQSLEEAIDRMESILPPLSHFVLPGGTRPACQAHVARCICRRAERAVVHLLRSEPSRTVIQRYLNRLSDFLFVLSRWANQKGGVSDVTWSGRQPAGNKEDTGGPDTAS
jgi:cob(I)alamin adenosyltransferase